MIVSIVIDYKIYMIHVGIANYIIVDWIIIDWFVIIDKAVGMIVGAESVVSIVIVAIVGIEIDIVVIDFV